MERTDIFDYEYARHCVMSAMVHHKRSGQQLLNQLPINASMVIIGTEWDPFEHDYSTDELVQWISDHFIFEDTGLVGKVFNGNSILWERNAAQ